MKQYLLLFLLIPSFIHGGNKKTKNLNNQRAFYETIRLEALYNILNKDVQQLYKQLVLQFLDMNLTHKNKDEINTTLVNILSKGSTSWSSFIISEFANNVDKYPFSKSKQQKMLLNLLKKHKKELSKRAKKEEKDQLQQDEADFKRKIQDELGKLPEDNKQGENA